MYKISVIIPVHNTEKYIEECLNSVINQTLKDIEVICVDDASTDSSLEILNKYAEKDNRIKIYQHNASKSALGARKTGVENANSEYIMFLDADDFYSVDACEIAYNKITEKDVDIANFSTKIINCADISEDKIKANELFLKPYTEITDKPLDKCFAENKYGHNLWSKIYKAEVCKKAVKELEDIHMSYAEDLYMYFVISYYANSYYGWESKALYNYCYGRGITGKQQYSLERFEKLCRHSVTVNSLYRFSENKSDSDSLKTVIDRYYKEWINDCVGVWFADVNKADKSKALKMLFNYWGVKEITSIFAKRFWNRRTEIADMIGEMPITPIDKREIKTIAFYYYCYSIGGVERVLSLLMPKFVEMGYRVVLLTDKEPSENDFVLLEGVERFVLFDKDVVTGDNFSNRADSWNEAIKKYNIDMVLYCFWRSHLYLYDVMYLKGMDIPVILQAHGVFSLAIAEMHKNFSEHTKTFALADGMSVLSDVDKMFWETYVDNVHYIPNPVSPELFDVESGNFENNAVIWIGRASYEKNPQAPFEIMKRVVVNKPDAKMYLLGDFDDPKWQTITKEYNLQDNIIFTGFVSDVSEYIKKSSVHLMTSNFEGFPMALVEAKAHALPTVMYGMPHLMLGKQKSGTIGVDMHDYNSAANEIVKLLKYKEYWIECSTAALNAVDEIKNFDFNGAWEKIITGKKSPNYSNDLTKRFVNTVVNHYDLGAKNALAKQQFANQRKSVLGKIKGGLNCIREKGVGYTVKLILKR